MAAIESRKPFEGQLNKFTNVVKGWQFRWLVLDPENGTLQYFLTSDEVGNGSEIKKPARGTQYLGGATVVPSDEDSQSFNVNFASGEVYKLRASNVKDRQIWVDRIRGVVQMHDKALNAIHVPSHPIREYLPPTPHGSRSHINHNGEPSEALQTLSLSVLDAFGSAHDILHQTNLRHRELVTSIEKSPRCFDDDLLLLKATSQSALLCLESALMIIQDYRESHTTTNNSTSSKSATTLAASPKKSIFYSSANPSPTRSVSNSNHSFSTVSSGKDGKTSGR